MSLLKEKDRTASLEEIVSFLASEGTSLPKKVAVTFDDGYRDIYTHAFPILKQFCIPATIFLIAGWVGKKEFLSWEEVREMSQQGITFGSHTQNHLYLPSVSSRESLKEEIDDSKAFLEDRLGREIPFFSYPVGGFTEEVKETVRKAGYKAAFTTNRREKGNLKDLYALTRIKMTESSGSFPVFQVKTSGYYEQFKRKKRPY